LGEDSFPSIAQMKAHGYWGVPRIDALFEATISLVCARLGCRKSEAAPTPAG
jgi:hypothetical protein